MQTKTELTELSMVMGFLWRERTCPYYASFGTHESRAMEPVFDDVNVNDLCERYQTLHQ